MEWVWRNGCGGATPEQPTLTHTFLDGGCAYVPPRLAGAFLGAFAEAVAAGRAPAVAERAVGVYRMFADLDIKSPSEGADDDGLAELVLARCLPHLPSALCRPGAEIVVCTRPVTPFGGTQSVKTGAEGAQSVKTGAHLYWSDVWVDDRVALALRDAWVRATVSAAEDDDETDWAAVIDAAVYKKSGLRMPWAPKKARNDVANASDVVYRPAYVVQFGKEPGTSPSLITVDPDDAAKDMGAWLERTALCGGCQSMSDFALEFAANAPSTSSASSSSTTSKAHINEAAAERALRAALPERYADCRLACKSASPASALVTCGSRWCHAADRDHSSNHVYFVVRPDGGVDQLCHSKGCGGARTRVCQLGAAGRRAFFPGTSKKADRPTPSLRPRSARDVAVAFLEQRKRSNSDHV